MVTIFNKVLLHFVDALLAAVRLGPAVRGTYCGALIAKPLAFGARQLSVVDLFLEMVSNRAKVTEGEAVELTAFIESSPLSASRVSTA